MDLASEEYMSQMPIANKMPENGRPKIKTDMKNNYF